VNEQQRAKRVAEIFAEQDAQAVARAPRPSGWGSRSQRLAAQQAAAAFRACLAADEKVKSGDDGKGTP
jgi:hypothetical protein